MRDWVAKDGEENEPVKAPEAEALAGSFTGCFSLLSVLPCTPLCPLSTVSVGRLPSAGETCSLDLGGREHSAGGLHPSTEGHGSLPHNSALQFQQRLPPLLSFCW